MPKSLLPSLFSALAVVCILQLQGQPNLPPTHIDQSALLLQGFAYNRIGFQTTGHPFYGTDQYAAATVWYSGFRYDSVKIKYDIQQQLIVLADSSVQLPIALVRERIDSVRLENALFVAVHGKTLPSQWSGQLLERLAQGRYTLYRRQYKWLRKPARANDGTLPAFVYVQEIYLAHGQNFYKIDSEKSVYEALTDDTELARRFIKQHPLKKKSSNVDVFVALVNVLNEQLP